MTDVEVELVAAVKTSLASPAHTMSAPDLVSSSQGQRLIATLAGDTSEPVTLAEEPQPLLPADSEERDAGYPVHGWERYEFIEPLGQGGMGTVYKARDRRLGRLVALKFIRSGAPHLALRFMQEARAQARITHDNVCKVYEVGQVQGKVYIAMELVAGQALEQARAGIKLPDKVEVIRQAAVALHEAHRLSIVHRDIKPTNIMVKQLPDGLYRAVVMDFGLARQADDNQELTESGALLGTPAFMSPEQARGEVRNLDRRSDVYSLGATLYCLLDGEPPFGGDSTIDVLLSVIHKEPLPLRRRHPSLPADLETIVMKCLEKDPARRYDSALALADDLGRYIDGEPIKGRRAGVLYRVRVRARKHKALVAIGTSAVLCIGVSTGLALRTQWRAAAQVRLTQQFSEAAKEAEGIMQRAHLLPLHDTRREQRLATQRLQQITEQLRAAGPLADGPGHYALGRGYLAIGEYDRAQKELWQAQASGYDSSGLRYAQGRVLGEHYRRELAAAEFIPSSTAKATRQREIERMYLQPALRYLSSFTGAADLQSERPYAEALLAYYSKDYDRAMDKAQEALTKEPWRYEALKLRGEIFMRRGQEEIDKGSFSAALTQFARANEAFTTTAELGRSDSAVYASQAEEWLQVLGAEALGLGLSPERSFAQLLASCSHALQASPDDTDVLLIKLHGYAWLLQYKEVHGQIEPEVDTALSLIEQVKRLRPNDINVHNGAGNIFLTKAHYELMHGQNPLNSYQIAISYFNAANSLASTSPLRASYEDIQVSLGSIYRQMATYSMQHGMDPQSFFVKSLQSYDAYSRTDNDLYQAYKYRSLLFKSWGDYEAKSGRDPRPFLERGITAQSEAVRLAPDRGGSYGVLPDLYLDRFAYELQQGLDPEESLRLAESVFQRAAAVRGEAYRQELVRGRLLLHRAMLDFSRGMDPTTQLVAARQVLDVTIESYKDSGLLYLDRCRVELLAARWAVHNGQLSRAADRFAAAEAAIHHALRINDNSSELLRHAALLYYDQAAAMRREQRLRMELVRRGLGMAERALALDAKDEEARALRGALLLLQAQSASSDSARSSAAQAAVGMLAEALRRNGNLQREYQPLLQQASALTALRVAGGAASR